MSVLILLRVNRERHAHLIETQRAVGLCCEAGAAAAGSALASAGGAGSWAVAALPRWETTLCCALALLVCGVVL